MGSPNCTSPGFKTWRSILDVARRAPSPHNVQPWRVELVSDDEAELFVDGGRTLPKEDGTGSFLLSAMGMFIEAIDLLAAPSSLRLDVQLRSPAITLAAIVSQPCARGMIPFARLKLVPDPGVVSLYAEQLFAARRTSRVSLRPAPVPPAAVETLAALSRSYDQVYAHLSKPCDIQPIIDRNIDAVFHDMNVRPYHEEITGWFRYTDRSTQRHNDGLDWRCMNLSPLEFWLSAKLPGLLRTAATRAVFKRRYRRQLGHVPAIGIIAGDFFNPENAIGCGRYLMRFWLELARLNLYLHPYGNLVTNPEAATWLQVHTGIAKAWLVFKIGYSDVPPLSRRRSVDDILLQTRAASR